MNFQYDMMVLEMRNKTNINNLKGHEMILTFENGDYDEEIEVEVEFDYEPSEAMTRHYPGCDESVSIYEIKRVDNGAELFLIDNDLEVELSEKILDELHQEADEREIDRYEWNL